MPLRSEGAVKSQSGDSSEEADTSGSSRRRLFTEPLREPYPLRSGFRSPTSDLSPIPTDNSLEASSGPVLSPTTYPDIGRVRVTLLTPPPRPNLAPVQLQQQAGSHSVVSVRPVSEPTPPETPELHSPVGGEAINLLMVRSDSNAMITSSESSAPHLVCNCSCMLHVHTCIISK